VSLCVSSPAPSSQLSEEDYNKAIAQLRNETEKIVTEFRQAYAQKQIDNEGYTFLKKAMVIIY
jgi:hypothetical protein